MSKLETQNPLKLIERLFLEVDRRILVCAYYHHFTDGQLTTVLIAKMLVWNVVVSQIFLYIFSFLLVLEGEYSVKK